MLQNLPSQLDLIMKFYASERSKGLENGCSCLQVTFYLANTYDRKENFKASTDDRPKFRENKRSGGVCTNNLVSDRYGLAKSPFASAISRI